MELKLRCVNCGNKATKGSMKHPFCTACFKKKFNNDYNAYDEFLNKTH